MNDNCKTTEVGKESMFFIVVDHNCELAMNALDLIAEYLPATESKKLNKALRIIPGDLAHPPAYKVYFTASELVKLISAFEVAMMGMEEKIGEQEELLHVLNKYATQLEGV